MTDPVRTALSRLVGLKDDPRYRGATWWGEVWESTFAAARAALAEPPVPSVPVAALADLVDDWRRTAARVIGDTPVADAARLLLEQVADELSALVGRLGGEPNRTAREKGALVSVALRLSRAHPFVVNGECVQLDVESWVEIVKAVRAEFPEPEVSVPAPPADRTEEDSRGA